MIYVEIYNKLIMPETKTPQNKKAFNAFVAKYNLDPLNVQAIMNCLFELNEKIEETAKYISIDVDTVWKGMVRTSLYKKWNEKLWNL